MVPPFAGRSLARAVLFFCATCRIATITRHVPKPASPAFRREEPDGTKDDFSRPREAIARSLLRSLDLRPSRTAVARKRAFQPRSGGCLLPGLADVAVLVCASARRQVAGCAKHADARPECVTGAYDRIRWDVAQKSILRTIWQRRAASEPGAVTMVCVGVIGVGVIGVSVIGIGLTRVSMTRVAHIFRRGRMCAN